MRYMNNDKYSTSSRIYSRSKVDKKRLQKEDIQTAIELGYPAVVIQMLEKEPDASKRQHILSRARNGVYK